MGNIRIMEKTRKLLFRFKGLGGVPKIRDTFWGVPITRTIAFWGLCWGATFHGNCHIIIWGLGTRVRSLGSRDCGLGIKVSGLGLRDWVLGFRTLI